MNTVILMGRLTRDPEIRATQSGAKVARYTLAIDRPHKADAEKVTDFINCVAWERAADFAERYLTQGQRVLVSGRIQTGSYTNREGVKVPTFEVVVSSQEFADNKQKTETAPPSPAQSADGGFVDAVDDAGLPWA